MRLRALSSSGYLHPQKERPFPQAAETPPRTQGAETHLLLILLQSAHHFQLHPIDLWCLDISREAIFSYHLNYPTTLKRTRMSLDAETLESLALLADKWLRSGTRKCIGGRHMILHFDTNELIQISQATSATGGKVLPWLKAGNIAAVARTQIP